MHIIERQALFWFYKYLNEFAQINFIVECKEARQGWSEPILFDSLSSKFKLFQLKLRILKVKNYGNEKLRQEGPITSIFMYSSLFKLNKRTFINQDLSYTPQ